MRILITGVKGFVGSYLLNYFKTTEHKLFGFDVVHEKMDQIQTFNEQSMNEIPEVDCVIMAHAAVSSGNTKINNELLFHVNVSITERLSEKFSNAFFIYLSTASIYEKSETITERSNIVPQTQYAISKYWGERVLENKKHAILRLSSVFGIGMKENTLIPNYINQALKEKKIQVWGKGSRKQNYIAVDEVVRYVLKILDNQEKIKNQILLGVDSTEYTNVQVAEMIADLTHSSIEFINEDYSFSLGYNNVETNYFLSYQAQSDLKTKLKEYIQWKMSNI